MIKLKTKKIVKDFFNFSLASLLLCSAPAVSEIESQSIPSIGTHQINFNDVPIIEFIRFVSKISQVNFIFDTRDLQFNVTFSTGKAVNAEEVFRALVQMLRSHGFSIEGNKNYYVIHKIGESSDKTGSPYDSSFREQSQFFVYKLQYHQGSEIEEAMKKIAADLGTRHDAPKKLLNAIQSTQWMKTTNSLLCSADEETIAQLKQLIEKLDTPSRQVFIEVLVVETDARKGLEFGLQWTAESNLKGRFGTVQANTAFDAHRGHHHPQSSGFDIGVIGDLITHKGRTFLSLASLVSALQVDADTSIVLNQKIITQDNKNSKIFVGDNIPFTGSVVQTIGQGQQTTANIEYRDIGVNLSITPMLGEGDVITLDINEEITESLDHHHSSVTAVNGIRTTKTNMVTHVHVPDQHFLVLSGMIRNSKARHKSGLPCLGGLPVVGAAFSKTDEHNEKRNVIIFVRPSIIHTFDEYSQITQKQENLFKAESRAKDFEEALHQYK